MRVDQFLFDIKKFDSRTKAKEAVERGEVLVNGKKVKPSYNMNENDQIVFCDNAGIFVSNGAFKLKKAFEDFDFIVQDKIVVDIGASTGGFTQCLLMHGAKRVYAVDVGESLLHFSLSSDCRVIVMDKTNARYLNKNSFSEHIDVVVSDVSFISLSYILPAISDILDVGGQAVVLIKPQFECGKSHLSKNGIVHSEKVRSEVCNNIISFAESVNLHKLDISVAPLREGKNIEYLLHLIKK